MPNKEETQTSSTTLPSIAEEVVHGRHETARSTRVQKGAKPTVDTVWPAQGGGGDDAKNGNKDGASDK